MTRQIDRIMSDAVAQGLLGEAVLDSGEASPPWPVLVMTGLMTLLASLPIFGALYFLIFDGRNIDSVIPGLVVIACATGLLRIPKLVLFGQYFGASLLGSGVVLIAANARSVEWFAASGVLTLLATILVPQQWLRIVLAAGGVFQLIHASAEFDRMFSSYAASEWSGCHVGLLVWLFAQTIQRAFERDSRYGLASWLETVMIGAAATIIVMLAYVSGSTFLAGGLLHGMDFGDLGWGGTQPFHSAASVFFALMAFAWLLGWKEMGEKRWLIAIAPVVIALSWFATSLGALVLAATACLIWRRPHLAILSAVAALWTIGALYYAIAWPLAYKSALLMVAGLAMLASTRLFVTTEVQAIPVPVESAGDDRPWLRWAIIGPAVVALAMTNVGIWKNERILSQGTTVFVELAPVDPRSLMQGDYMTLAFALPPMGMSEPLPVFVVAQRGDDGIAVLARYDDGQGALASGELLIQMSQRGGRSVFVTDAFFFKEGDGQRWARARYGEFRVDRNGKAVLIGLRGPELKAL